MASLDWWLDEVFHTAWADLTKDLAIEIIDYLTTAPKGEEAAVVLNVEQPNDPYAGFDTEHGLEQI